MSSEYVQGSGGYYKRSDGSGPYAIDSTGAAALMGGGGGGGGPMTSDQITDASDVGKAVLVAANAAAARTAVGIPNGTAANQVLKWDATNGAWILGTDSNTTYTLPAATDAVRGGVLLGSATVQTVAATAVSATASRTYAVQPTASGQLVVNVPWTNTTYSAATATVNGTVKLAAAVADSEAADVPALVAEFNALLASLRAAGVLAA